MPVKFTSHHWRVFWQLETKIKGDFLVLTKLFSFSVQIHEHLLSVYYASSPRDTYHLETVTIIFDLHRLTTQ